MNRYEQNKDIINEKLNEVERKSFELLKSIDSSDTVSYNNAYQINQTIHELKKHLIID